jgi:protein-disulfide isomerase
MSQKVKNDQKQQTRLLLGAVLVGALVIAAGFVLLSASGGGLTRASIDYSAIPTTKTSDGAVVLGNPEAPFTLVVFEDFMCGHCQTYEPELETYIKEMVATGRAKFEFRMLQSASPSPLMFQLVECAEKIKPGSFYTAREELFYLARTGWRADSGPRSFASALGLNYNEVLTCQATATQHMTDAQLAQQVGAQGTPSVFIRVNNSAPRVEARLGARPDAATLRRFIEEQFPSGS